MFGRISLLSFLIQLTSHQAAVNTFPFKISTINNVNKTS